MMTEGDLVWSSLMTLYILIAVWYSEEPALIELIGEEYVTYTQEVPAYCPMHLPGCFCSRKKSKKIKSEKVSDYLKSKAEKKPNGLKSE